MVYLPKPITIFTHFATWIHFKRNSHRHLLLKFLTCIGHAVELLLNIPTSVMSALKQLLTEQLQRLEGAGAGVHLGAMLLYIRSGIKYGWTVNKMALGDSGFLRGRKLIKFWRHWRMSHSCFCRIRNGVK